MEIPDADLRRWIIAIETAVNVITIAVLSTSEDRGG
jgi:hypothetical protein